jgi:LacI family transcriptional regulator
MVAGRENRSRKRVTLKDVAELAGVSLKTASNVKNDWPYVSDETRQRVKQAMTELGYRPSLLARSLKTGRTMTMGVIVPDISNPFFSTVFLGCEDELALHGYSAYLCNTVENVDREQYYLNLLVNQGVDGIILWGSRVSAGMLAECTRDDLPLVSVDGVAQNSRANLTLINVDNIGGAEQITRHLIQYGYTCIAYIYGASHRLPARQRLEGYRRALERAGLPYIESLTLRSKPSISGGYRATMELLSDQRPDALFCYNDLMAIGAIAAAEELGLRVPGDLGVVGFDDILPASLITPLLTTVCIPQYQLGRAAAQQLLARIENPQVGAKTLLFPVELRIRNSCGTRMFGPDERRELLHSLVSSHGMSP